MLSFSCHCVGERAGTSQARLPLGSCRAGVALIAWCYCLSWRLSGCDLRLLGCGHGDCVESMCESAVLHYMRYMRSGCWMHSHSSFLCTVAGRRTAWQRVRVGKTKGVVAGDDTAHRSGGDSRRGAGSLFVHMDKKICPKRTAIAGTAVRPIRNGAHIPSSAGRRHAGARGCSTPTRAVIGYSSCYSRVLYQWLCTVLLSLRSSVLVYESV